VEEDILIDREVLYKIHLIEVDHRFKNNESVVGVRASILDI
jgi:hypothetical protein